MTNINLEEFGFAKLDQERKCTVIYTKSRREKKVCQFCETLGIKHYLPLEKRLRVYGRKKVETSVPLFPGYLFCFMNGKEKERLFSSHQVAKVLELSNQEELIHDIERIYRTENNGVNLIPCDNLQIGAKAKIASGPLKGVEGIVSELRGKKRLILNVDFINHSAAFEVDKNDLVILN